MTDLINTQKVKKLNEKANLIHVSNNAPVQFIQKITRISPRNRLCGEKMLESKLLKKLKKLRILYFLFTDSKNFLKKSD